MGALLLVCVRACGDTKDSRRARHTEEKRRDAETEGGDAESESAKEGRGSERDEKVIQPLLRSRIPQLKFDSTSSSSCGESSMSGKTKGKEDKEHATKGQSRSNPTRFSTFTCMKEPEGLV